MNRSDSLFLEMKCANCGNIYVFWRGLMIEELEKYNLKCCKDPKLKGELPV